ncbi:MAG: heme exporter protein CcmD [Pseudomonadota bacterium]
MIDFFAMGGYAGYVWSSVIITAIVMVANVVLARHAHRRMLEHVRRRALVERSAS